MGRIVFGACDEASPASPSDIAGRSGNGSIATAGLIVGDDRPILLWRHDLGAGAVLSFDRPATGHLLYILEGTARIREGTVSAGGAIVVERGAVAEIASNGGRLMLLDFHARNIGEEADRPGGHVHVIAPPAPEGEQPDSGTRHAMFVDSTCPTCSLWLDYLEFVEGYRAPLHWHTEPEIIVVVGGELRVGTRSVKAGGIIAIDEGARYSFSAGDGGLAFINFRPRDPFYVPVRKGETPAALRELDILNGFPPPAEPSWRVEAPGVDIGRGMPTYG
ncbi:MAG: hypothetical protein JWN66_993 [Sphingomonas bacterium]|uniref:hypothetical protein n=1 Tax=Sphingomonas bacterium TaxID=1895847 RepID=UPI002611C3A0|nr:hypothetical protein [Sphingomonas bacterium]MDB5703877.1 hypothetical protein [Sphingomonas bacterium]